MPDKGLRRREKYIREHCHKRSIQWGKDGQAEKKRGKKVVSKKAKVKGKLTDLEDAHQMWEVGGLISKKKSKQ